MLRTRIVKLSNLSFQWLSGSGLWVKSAFDGHKFVCADDFHSGNVDGGENCLVYSFGLSDDTSFEEAMAEAGCEVCI